jgi:hypothetical protein
MSRPRLELEKTYGKLTVVSDMGGGSVLVRCTCGDTKWVLRTNLRAGRIQSCGKPGCRTYTSGAPSQRKPSPVGPSWIPVDAIPGLYKRAQQPGAVPELARELAVSDSAVYGLLREIGERGGVEQYIEFLSSVLQTSEENYEQASSRIERRVVPGHVSAPPPFYDPQKIG